MTLKYSDITPKSVFLNRRQIIAGAAALGIGHGLARPAQAKTIDATKSKYTVDGEITPKEVVENYNNFYEFGTAKSDPARYAHQLTTDPWSVEIGGMVNKPGIYDLSDVLGGKSMQERIYRFRCVEAWSMIVPWIGFPLHELLAQIEPQSGAKYIAFETLYRPEEMPDQDRISVIPYPYVEGLRLDEALHDLTLMTTGMYGEELPNQNGAPLRLIVPWKYGFKSIKSIVKITLTDVEPPTSWNKYSKREYGFYSNVNPDVNHKRWSQASERPLGGGLFAGKIPTLFMNGYGDEVAGLYEGMDLAKFF